jgi:hypothetical protein
VKALAPYTVSTFATSPANASQPDSIVAWDDSIIVGFQNHVAKDGTDGKASTIVEFSLHGKVKRTFSVPGHNDGLRIVGDGKLWALQNEDANPNLVVIDLETGQQSAYQFAPLWNGHVLLEPVLNGNAEATDIATGATVSLNLLDPDSMTKDLKGNIVFTARRIPNSCSSGISAQASRPWASWVSLRRIIYRIDRADFGVRAWPGLLRFGHRGRGRHT